PLQLLSAAMWQVVQKGLVMHYGMLEEFVTSVTEMVPELLSYRQRAQLILGLRARVSISVEKCVSKYTHSLGNSSPGVCVCMLQVTDAQVEDSGASFLELVQTLLQDPGVKEHFFLEVFPVQYGQKYDTALEILLWEFLSRLEELLPVPDFAQMVSWLDGAPSVLDECLQSATPPEEMKALIEHHRNLGHIHLKNTCSLPMDDCILSSLSLPPVTKLGTTADKHTQKHSDCLQEATPISNHPNKEEIMEIPIDQSNLGTGKRRISERTRQKRNERRDRIETDEIVEEGTSFSANESTAYPMTTDTKVPWSDDETLNLIDIWGKDSVQRVLKGCVKNRHVFTLISKNMSERGYMRTVEQCQTRIKRLKNSFRQSLQQKVECTFFDQLERILGNVSLLMVPEVTYDVEEVTDDQLEDTDDWEFSGHSGLEEMGTRSVPWTDLETLTLINIWGDDKMQRELRGMHRNGHLFAVISQKMSAQGFIRTAEQCQTRVKRLKRSFRQCYENNINGREQVECKFYDLLERILGNELPSYVEMSENCLDMESRESWSADNECSVYSSQEREAVVGVPEDRKKIPWVDGETMILLELWGDDTVQQNLKRCPHNSHIYSEISEKLNFHGYYRTAEQCHTRIKRLKAGYRQSQETISSSGSEQVDLKFYDILDQILEMQPPTTRTSMEVDNNTTSERITPGSWSDPETLALIDIWGEDEVQRVLRDFVHNGPIYMDISEKMHDQGYSKTPEQCRWKVKSMRNNFRQCYNMKKCGRKGAEYKFYNQLERILGHEAVSIDEYDERNNQTVDQDTVSYAVTESSRKMPWSDRETQALLEVWGEDHVQLSLRGCLKNRHVFEYISRRMTAQAFLRTAEQCHTRIKRLKARFHHDKRECKFYDQMEEIFSRELNVDTSRPLTDGSKFTWSDSATQVLLSIWGSDEVQEDLKGCTKNRHIFTEISQAMANEGYLRTAEQCQSRVKQLKANFRQLCEREKVECKFYDQFVQIFGNKYLSCNSG
uniref:Zgc:113263 n=1 Tax=Salmo trutta TaxID=8032 RepID=A0A674B201_SALTR